jgi:hypothetical protein
MKAVAVLVFDFAMDPDTVEGFTLSRLIQYIKLGNDLHDARKR